MRFKILMGLSLMHLALQLGLYFQECLARISGYNDGDVLAFKSINPLKAVQKG
jgi:hypothetical protein